MLCDKAHEHWHWHWHLHFFHAGPLYVTDHSPIWLHPGIRCRQAAFHECLCSLTLGCLSFPAPSLHEWHDLLFLGEAGGSRPAVGRLLVLYYQIESNPMPCGLVRRWRWVSSEEKCVVYAIVMILSPTRQAGIRLAQKAVVVSFWPQDKSSIFPSACHTPPNLLFLVCVPWRRRRRAANSVVAERGRTVIV